MPIRKSYKVSKFQGGMKGAVYICRECGKKTRETGDGESSVGMCAKCYEEGGLINEHSDNDGQHMIGMRNGKFIYGKNPKCPICRHEAKNIGNFGGKGGIWRNLSPEEVKEFRKWARDNYVISTPINKLWHPVVQEECHKMNCEHSSGKTVGKFGGKIVRIPAREKNPGKGAGIRNAKPGDKKAEWAKKNKEP